MCYNNNTTTTSVTPLIIIIIIIFSVKFSSIKHKFFKIIQKIYIFSLHTIGLCFGFYESHSLLIWATGITVGYYRACCVSFINQLLIYEGIQLCTFQLLSKSGLRYITTFWCISKLWRDIWLTVQYQTRCTVRTLYSPYSAQRQSS
jgi:hypothetical protein